VLTLPEGRNSLAHAVFLDCAGRVGKPLDAPGCPTRSAWDDHSLERAQTDPEDTVVHMGPATSSAARRKSRLYVCALDRPIGLMKFNRTYCND